MLLVIWVAILLLGFFFSYRYAHHFSISQALMLGFLVRVVTLGLFPESYSTDVTGFLWSGAVILDKDPWYPSVYFPFFPYVGAVVYAVVPYIDPVVFLKTVFSIVDVAVIWMLFRLTGKIDIALLYAFNPLSILTFSIHGQFDSIPLLFFLGSVLLLHKKNEVFSVLSLSLAIHTKTWPFLFMIPILRRMKKKFLFLLIPIVPMIMILFHLSNYSVSLSDIVFPIKDYRGVYGVWGLGFIIQMLFPHLDASYIQIIRRISLLLFAGFVLVARRKNILQEIYVHLLFFFIVTLTFGAQWLSWLVPWVILIKPKTWKAFIVIGTLYILATFWSNVYPIQSTQIFMRDTLVLWLGFLTWLTLVVQFTKA